MNAAAAEKKQAKTSKTSLQQEKSETGPTLLPKPDGANSDALSKIISSASAPGDGGSSSTNPTNSRTAHLSHLIQTSKIQLQPVIGKRNDKYEQEADRVADQVMSMPAPTIRRKPT